MDSINQKLYHGLRYVLILAIKSRKLKCLIHVNFVYPFPFRLFSIECYIFNFWFLSALQELEKMFSAPPPQPKYQLRRTSSSPFWHSLCIWKFCRYDDVSFSLLWGWNLNMSYMNGSFRSSCLLLLLIDCFLFLWLLLCDISCIRTFMVLVTIVS